MDRKYTATLSPTAPEDKVLHREFHQFDGAQTETVFLLDPEATSVDGSIDDALGVGSCYLVDVSASDKSDPSPSVALDPGTPPPPGPKPRTPSILGVVFEDNPVPPAGRGPGVRTVDRRF